MNKWRRNLANVMRHFDAPDTISVSMTERGAALFEHSAA